MPCQLAFYVTSDGRLLANLQVGLTSQSGNQDEFLAVVFEDENIFIYGVVSAGFSNETTVRIISTVLLTMSGRHPSPSWISIEANEDQLAALGLQVAVL